MAKVNKTDSCWLWTGATVKGYGHIGAWVRGKWRMLRANRAAHELFIGPIPDGLHVLHTCNIKLCVNPGHLYAGTEKDNTEDKRRAGTLNFGVSAGKHHWTNEELKEMAALYEEQGQTMRTVADRFGTNPTQVFRAVRAQL